MNGYILAHDLGTSGNKATLYGLDGKLYASYNYSYETFYPHTQCVEQNPDDWWNAVCISTGKLISKAYINKNEVLCITFSGQMMGCLPVDKDGEAIRNSIIWADTRSKKQADYMENILGMENMYSITGHRVSASYTAAKLLWIKENERNIFNKTYKVLNAKDYIICKITGKFITDYSDASGTNMLDIKQKEWSDEILRSIGLSEDILPELHSSTDIVGKVSLKSSKEIGLLEGTPVIAGGGDGSCASVGATVVDESTAYNVIGSSSWISLASKKPIYDVKMRTFNWVHLDKELYSPCGTMQSAGYSYKWLKETLCKYEDITSKKTGENVYDVINREIENSAPGANNLLFLPYLLGERSPKWNENAKGAFIGLTITHTNKDVYRSVLEGVTFNLKAILDVFTQFRDIEDVVVIGGGAKSKVWMQILADIWQKNILIPQYLDEATSMGAAICGGIGIGAFENFKVAKKFNKIVTRVIPRVENKEKYDKLYKIFNDSYDALVPIYEELST